MTKNSNVIEHFLLIYDRKEDKLLSSRSYGTDGDVAARAYREAELRYHDRPEIDIVLVGSDSLETVKRTHSTYFRGFTAHDLQQLVDSLSFE